MTEPVTSLDELPRYLNKIRRVFDVAGYRARSFSHRDIQKYYTNSSAGYDLFHSEHGSVHMALNFDGKYDSAGFREQARIVRDALNEGDRTILELGCGKGFNIRVLASEDNNRSFVGIDLTRGHLFSARQRLRSLRHVRLVQGSFETLPFAPDTQDLLFEVESLCHAADMPGALSEVFRVLRPGGRIILFDAFRLSRPERNSEEVELAMELIEGAMAVPRFWVLDNWLSLARRLGFSIVRKENLSHAIRPNLNRLQFLARGFFKFPRLARCVERLSNPTLVANAIAGLLLPFSLEAGAHGYYLVELQKEP